MKHRTLTIFMRVWILPLLSFICIATGSATAAEYVSVVKDGVNLRSGPDTTYEILFQLPAGYPLQVLERRKDWIKVRDYENDRGWIYAGLVSTTPYVIVKVEDGNIRSGPGIEYDKTGKVIRDVILKKIGEQNDWLKISHPRLTGWIYKQLVWP
ncbi:MAG: peptide-binding protein [Candidatus Electrothrix sp. AR3]|nr:peptide-binding protein [Candidatus Electrothrix sp. AR3]